MLSTVAPALQVHCGSRMCKGDLPGSTGSKPLFHKQEMEAAHQCPLSAWCSLQTLRCPFRRLDPQCMAWLPICREGCSQLDSWFWGREEEA